MTSDQVLREREDIERAIAGKTLGDLLLRNAERHGELPAMSWKEGNGWRTLNWREVRDEVAAAAVGLMGIGVQHGDVVAIMAANRPEHVIADLAIMHAAGTPTTFYSTLAPDQIQYVAGDSAVKVAILENRDYMKRWQEIRDELPTLETIVLIEHADEFQIDGVVGWDDLVAEGRRKLDEDRSTFDERWRSVKPDDVACVIYTSGTTGPPKGVQITQHNIMFEAESIDRAIPLPDHLVGVSYLPFAHIAERETSIYIGLWKVAHGYFCPDPKQVLEYVQEARPHSFVGVPRVWEKVKAGVEAKIAAEENDTRRKLAQQAIRIGTAVARLEQQGRSPSFVLRAEHALLDRLVLSKVRANLGMDRAQVVITSTAPMAPDVAEFFRAIGLPFIEVWGMTELTGAATATAPGDFRMGTVGRPLPGIEITTAEEDGEILVRGPIQVPGYRNLDQATAELIDGDGWLHTGDVGEIDEDGYLRIVDRKKELIITAGGKNISPANIEALLKEHPLVGQALAYGDQKPYVTALLVLDGEVAPGWAESQGIEDTSLEALADHPKVREVLEQAVEKANSHLARVEQVKRFKVLPTEWTADTEELTPTLKLKRRVVHEKYRDEIESLYADS